MKKWEEHVRKVVPYTPGEQPNRPGMIKLNTNENPYPPAPGVRKALEELAPESFRLYPDPAASDLVDALAEYYGKDRERFFVGVGSDDVIAMAFQTFFNSEKPILFPDISYSFYSVWAELFGIPCRRPALDEAFRLVKEDYFGDNGGIIFPNPNAPTGLYLELSEVEEILKRNPDPDDFSKVREALEAQKIPMMEASVTMIPQTWVELSDEEDIKKLNRILDLLDDDDDVQAVYHNWDE